MVDNGLSAVNSMRGGDGQTEPNSSPLTVEELAAAKRLPAGFLHSTCRVSGNGKRGVGIKYYGLGGDFLAVKNRLALRGDRGFRWPFGTPAATYGDWRLPTNPTGMVVFVEGETDTWTLWYHKICGVLGFPGAHVVRALRAEHLAAIHTIFVCKEPDVGGAAFVTGIAQQLANLEFTGRLFVIKTPEGCKDVSDLHISDPDRFEAAFADMLDRRRQLELPTKERERRPEGYQVRNGQYYVDGYLVPDEFERLPFRRPTITPDPDPVREQERLERLRQQREAERRSEEAERQRQLQADKELNDLERSQRQSHAQCPNRYCRNMCNRLGLCQAMIFDCDSWNCFVCAPLLKGKHRDNLTEKITTTPDVDGPANSRCQRTEPVYVMDSPPPADSKAWRDLYEDYVRGSDYVCVDGPRSVIVATVPFPGCTPLSPTDAAKRATEAVDAVLILPDTTCPVHNSRSWGMPKRQPTGWTVIGSLPENSSPMEITAAIEANDGDVTDTCGRRPRSSIFWSVTYRVPADPDEVYEFGWAPACRRFHEKLVSYLRVGGLIDEDDWLRLPVSSG